jgi:hypothetical protein
MANQINDFMDRTGSFVDQKGYTPQEREVAEYLTLTRLIAIANRDLYHLVCDHEEHVSGDSFEQMFHKTANCEVGYAILRGEVGEFKGVNQERVTAIYSELFGFWRKEDF